MAIDEGDRLAAVARPILDAQPNPPRVVSIRHLVAVDLAQEVAAAVIVLVAVGLTVVVPMAGSARSVAVAFLALALVGFPLIIAFDLRKKADAIRRGVVASGRITDVTRARGGPVVSLHVSLGGIEADVPGRPWTLSAKPQVGQSIKLLADPDTGWPLALLGLE